MVYISFNHIFYKIDWIRYEQDSEYYIKVSKILQGGVFRIKGNETSLQSCFLIGLLVIGAILSLVMFIYFRKNYRTRTFTPLISLAGYLLPLVVRLGNNVVAFLFISYLLALVGALFTMWSLKNRI